MPPSAVLAAPPLRAAVPPSRSLRSRRGDPAIRGLVSGPDSENMQVVNFNQRITRLIDHRQLQ